MTITGIDVSPWQFKPYKTHDPDFAAVASVGHRFVYIKATQGTQYRYQSFKKAWPEVKAAGMYPGAYHFLDWRPGVPDGAKQARFFFDWVGPLSPGELSPAVDVEWIKGAKASNTDIAKCAFDFLEACDELFGRWSLIYIGNTFWKGYVLGGDDAQKLKSWRRWQVDYQPPLDEMKAAPGWPLIMHQHTGDGECLGVEGNVDLNRFLGSEAELRQLAALEPVAP
jgi:lysozyme